MPRSRSFSAIWQKGLATGIAVGLFTLLSGYSADSAQLAPVPPVPAKITCQETKHRQENPNAQLHNLLVEAIKKQIALG